MFDIGWPELLVIGVVALVVIGPKDLPKVLHTVGKWVRKARGLAREFQSSVDEMVREAELEDLRKQVQQARSLNLQAQVEKAIDPKGEMRETLSFDDLALVEEGDDPATPATRPSPGTPAAKPDPGAPIPPAVPAVPALVEHRPAMELGNPPTPAETVPRAAPAPDPAGAASTTAGPDAQPATGTRG